MAAVQSRIISRFRLCRCLKRTFSNSRRPGHQGAGRLAAAGKLGHVRLVAAARRAPLGSGTKKLWHPRLGSVNYSHVVLQLADQPDQTLVTYSAE